MGLSGSKGKSKDEKLFEDLYYELFEKYKTDIEGGYVKIPKDKFTTLHLMVENRLFRSMDRQGKSFIQILNTSDAKPSQLFAENLCKELDKRFKMKSRLVQMPEKGNAIVVICNKTDNLAEEQAVNNCLVNIEKEFYKDIVLIVLHVKRKEQLPLIPTKNKIQHCEVGTVVDMGFEEDIYQCETNNEAFLEMEKFCFKPQSMSIDVVTEPSSIQSHSSGVQGGDILILLHVVEKPNHITENMHNENVKCIIEMAFTIEKGIYDCEMNKNAFAKLTKIHSNPATFSTTKHRKKQKACSEIDVAPTSSESLLEQQGANCMDGPAEEPTKKPKTETETHVIQL